MTELAIDYAGARPSPATVKAAGVSGVIRYASHSTWKNITRPEADALRAAGLWVALVWEGSPTRVNTGGIGGGAADAHDAEAFADALGYPADAVIFYACDTTPIHAAASAYFHGVASNARRPVGWYGGMQVGLALKAEGLVDIVWVANAASWSGYPHFDDLKPIALATAGVSMLQSTEHPLVGIDPNAYDLDYVVAPFPAWGRSSAPTPPPSPPTPPVQGPPIDIGDNVKTTPIKGIHLDDHGDGVVDVKGVAEADIVGGIVVVGGNDPLNPKSPRYDATPIVRVVGNSNPARLVITGGVPGGVYTVKVPHA